MYFIYISLIGVIWDEFLGAVCDKTKNTIPSVKYTRAEGVMHPLDRLFAIVEMLQIILYSK